MSILLSWNTQIKNLHLIGPIITYGAEAWTMDSKEMHAPKEDNNKLYDPIKKEGGE